MKQNAGSVEEEQSGEMQCVELSLAGAVTPGNCTDLHRHGMDLLLQVPRIQSEAAARRQNLSHRNMLLKMSDHKSN